MNAAARIVTVPGAEKEWRLPLETVLANTQSWLKRVIIERSGRGDGPDQSVRVFLVDGRPFAEVRWSCGLHHPLTIALDEWVLEALR